MFKVSRKTRSFAQDLRSNPTDAEKKLWQKLKMKQLDCKFRRQFPIPPYIVDFACLEKKLIIEIDGGQHEGNIADEKRTNYLQAKGYRALRFWNNEILNNIEGVLEVIVKNLKTETPPS